jgi:hypothetical protein
MNWSSKRIYFYLTKNAYLGIGINQFVNLTQEIWRIFQIWKNLDSFHLLIPSLNFSRSGTKTISRLLLDMGEGMEVNKGFYPKPVSS